MTVYGDRAKRLPAPPHVVWRDLVERRRRGARSWLLLRNDEVVPDVLESVEPTLVVWSSLWPARPADRIRLELTSRNSDTLLRFVMMADDDGPPGAELSHLRYRLNRLLWEDLRRTYDA